MSVTITLGGFNATVNEGQWVSDDPTTLETLEATVPFGGVPGDSPNPDRTLAEIAVNLLGAIITDEKTTEQPEGLIY